MAGLLPLSAAFGRDAASGAEGWQERGTVRGRTA